LAPVNKKAHSNDDDDVIHRAQFTVLGGGGGGGGVGSSSSRSPSSVNVRAKYGPFSASQTVPVAGIKSEGRLQGASGSDYHNVSSRLILFAFCHRYTQQ
jgi:hypothetical protein